MRYTLSQVHQSPPTQNESMNLNLKGVRSIKIHFFKNFKHTTKTNKKSMNTQTKTKIDK